MTTTIRRETLPTPESDRAQSLRQLPPEVRSLVDAVMDAVLMWAEQQSNSKFEQGFEFPWGHFPRPARAKTCA